MRSIQKQLNAALLALVALGLFATPLYAANIILNIVDPPGVGFNDPTPVKPVGGNSGTTVGEQRVIVFQTAAQKWGDRLKSDVDIILQSAFLPLNCTATGGTLGAAGTIQIFAFADDEDLPPGAIPNTWYHSALANALANVDISPGPPDPGLLVPPFNDDIVAFFNSNLGSPGCLENSGWYYGLDHKESQSEIDLLAVVMHEIAHGEGFSEFASSATGELVQGLPGIYSTFMLDTSQNITFAEMTDAQRLDAQVAGEDLVWIGPRVTKKAKRNLDPRGAVRTFFPKSVKGSFTGQAASFGPEFRKSRGPFSALVLGDDEVDEGNDGCEEIQNRVRYRIVLLDRGNCAFTQKVLNAQRAGAKGVMIANNVKDGPAPMGGSDPDITIHSVGISQEQGNTFKDALPGFVLVQLFGHRKLLSGADENGNVRLYAPNPVQPGSSKSHFDVSAVPNLLMEPAINDDLRPTKNLDLSDDLMRDIGWKLQ